MKKLTLFQCEICGTDFKAESDAKNCEKFHVKAKEIVGQRFTPWSQQGSNGYPHTITVRMEDGKIITFRG